MKTHRITGLAAAAAAALACGVQGSARAQRTEQTFKAHLTALNSAGAGPRAEGEATFRVVGDVLQIHVKMRGVPANIEHWEHFHGFPDGKPATCAAAPRDANKDGLVDLIETESASGTTMVPFNHKPEDMVIPTHTYPRANAKGVFEYTKSVPLTQLSSKFGQVYPGGRIDLDKRVIYIHGVPASSALPGTVKSLGPIPAHVTLPIACGKIVRVTH